jgi:serine/threonine-protein kinase
LVNDEDQNRSLGKNAYEWSVSQRVIDRYAIGPAIAAGGVATVHFGRIVGSIGFTRTVAIKRLHNQFATDPKFVSMFVDEARLAARVRHPNVVPTLDVLVDGGEVFVVLEYIHGQPLHLLARALPPTQRIPLRIAAGIAFGVLVGLHAAHDARNERGEPLRIVHRDVSPHNIVLGPDGVPRVIDFGFAKAFGRMRTTEDRNEVKGKLAYMAPEQLTPGGRVDQRTDVYAASLVLWELLAGRKLFRAEDPAQLLRAIRNGETEPPSRYPTESTPAVDAIVMRGLARDPASRWPTARAMALALEDCTPLATAPHIGAWAERMGHAELAARAKLIAELEADQKTLTLAEVFAEIRGIEEATITKVDPPR